MNARRWERARGVADRWRQHTSAGLLLIDSSREECLRLQTQLESQGIAVRSCQSGAAGLIQFGRQAPAAVIIEAGIRDVACDVWVEAARAASGLPIFVATVSNDSASAGPALFAGATGVVVRPYEPDEILRRVLEWVDRSPETKWGDGCLRVGPLELDRAAYRVRLHEQDMSLPLKEFELLACLMQNAHRVVTAAELCQELWGQGPERPSCNALKTHVRKLRTSLGDPLLVRTVRGQGYTLNVYEGLPTNEPASA